MGQRIPNQYVLEVYRGQLFAVRREQGRLGELEPALKEFVQQSPRLAIWRCGLALLYSYEGRLAEARSEFERLAANEFTDLRQDSLWFVSVAYLSEVCASLGDTRRAAKLYELLLPYAERTITLSATHCCGSAAHYLALLAATMTHWEEAAQHFEAALARHLTMGARLWLAHTQYDYAKMLLARGGPGDREQALPLLAQALATAQQLGMTRLAEQAFALQGETDRARDAATYPKALSAREVEVLRLIAAGQTNKEIAEALVVSVPTVERHIANIYSKINARGRADAATYALKHGLVRLDGP